jgi:hypothetical protein
MYKLRNAYFYLTTQIHWIYALLVMDYTYESYVIVPTMKVLFSTLIIPTVASCCPLPTATSSTWISET